MCEFLLFYTELIIEFVDFWLLLLYLFVKFVCIWLVCLSIDFLVWNFDLNFSNVFLFYFKLFLSEMQPFQDKIELFSQLSKLWLSCASHVFKILLHFLHPFVELELLILELTLLSWDNFEITLNNLAFLLQIVLYDLELFNQNFEIHLHAV